MPLSAGTRLGPYEILSALGAGGMGEVYKARDTRLDRTVAVKVLPSHVSSDPTFRERFEREAKTLAALSHPHICPVFDVGRQDDVNFLVMEYLDGDTLAARLAKGALPIDQALAIAIQMADALDKAHRAGIVHRDLKPGNVMLVGRGGSADGRRGAPSGAPIAKLLDFGLAKTGAVAIAGSGASMLPTTPPHLTAQGTILGTFQYMAPEQLEGKDADARTDIFAFGALLYEMLTGRKAFEGKTHASLIGAIMHAEPPAPSQLAPLTPPLVDRVVRKCLAKDPEDRWQSASDLREALDWIVSGASTATAAMAAAPAQVSPSHRRRAWLLAAAATVVAALFASAGTVLYVRNTAPPRLVTRLDVVTPPSNDPASFAISPDGRRLAFVATGEPSPSTKYSGRGGG